MSKEALGQKGGRRSLAIRSIPIAAVMLFGFCWSILLCQREQAKRTMPLDIDGWGHRVAELKANHSIAVLFEKPSVWKGPIVPFVYGLVYYFFPYDESILVFNSICFAFASGLLVFLGCRAGFGWMSSSLAAMLWIIYPPHSYVHGYYFAESLISLLALCTLTCYLQAICRPSIWLDLLTGVVSGVLLLSRPPFILALSGSFVFLILKSREGRVRRASLILLGGAVVVMPWIIRNYMEWKAFVPFTLEGGKILYQGTYLPGDDLTMNELRNDPVFATLESTVETTMSPIEQYHSWQAEAKKNIAGDPVGQGVLMIRKTIRFWAYLARGSWMPALLTGVSSTVFLILGMIGFLRYRGNVLVALATIFTMGVWLFHALVHAELRYNFPVMNLLLLVAMLGLTGFSRRVSEVFFRTRQRSMDR